MSVLDAEAPVPVEVGPCRCAGSPHERDVVYLHPHAPMELGLAAEVVLQVYSAVADAWPHLCATYVEHGVADWTFLDDEGLAIPVTRENVRRAISWDRGGREVTEKAVELYHPSVMRPLLARASTSSPPTSIAGRTSATSGSARARRKRSA